MFVRVTLRNVKGQLLYTPKSLTQCILDIFTKENLNNQLFDETLNTLFV